MLDRLHIFCTQWKIRTQSSSRRIDNGQNVFAGRLMHQCIDEIVAIARIKCAVADAVVFRIEFCIFNCLFDYFDAENFFAVLLVSEMGFLSAFAYFEFKVLIDLPSRNTIQWCQCHSKCPAHSSLRSLCPI